MSASRVPTDPRISRRRRAIARTRSRRLIGIGATVAGLVAVGWTAFASPLLAIDEVKVVGAKHTTAAEIARAAGLGPDDNLLLVSTDAIADSAETLPWVKRADVDRMLPGTVRVRIVERVPALILSIGAARWTIDARGHVLAVGAAAKGLPVIGGSETGDVEVGGRVGTPELAGALKAFRSLDRKLRKLVSSVIAPGVERISFSLDDGTLIRFGAAERLDAKNEVLNALLEDLERDRKSVSYIDVRVPTSPAIAQGTPAPGATPQPTPRP